MKIQQSAVFLNGQHNYKQISAKVQQLSVKEAKEGKGSEVSLSLSSKTQQKLALQATSMVRSADGRQNSFYTSEFTKQLTEAITESKIDISQWQGNLQSSSRGKLIEIQSVTQVKAEESLSFEALGKVQTEDGRVIDFMLALDFVRSTEIQESAYFSGRVEMIDPLMLNINGGTVDLTDQWFDFDLLANGSNKGLLKTAQGSGYLAFDKNNNGVIDNGRELFGPMTNDGFEELRQFDEDGNGWIDANDSIYSQLGMLTFNEEGAVFISAKDAGLGAIYLGAISSDYQLLSDEGKALGSIKQTGVGLSEQGKTLLIQEVHLQLNSSANSLNSNSLTNLRNGAAMNIRTPLTVTTGASLTMASNEVSTLVQGKLQQMDLRQWAQAAMADFSNPNSFDFNTALKNMAADQFNYQWSPGERISLETGDESSLITSLRNMVEMLKQMREAQKSQQQPLAAYSRVMKAL